MLRCWAGLGSGALALALGCGGAATGDAGGPPAPTDLAGPGAAPPAPDADSSAGGTPAPAAEAPPTPCGALDCQLFATPEAAFEAVIAAERPRMLAVGESHKQKGAPDVPSTTHRFTTTLLPRLKGRTTDLVVELWVADPKCKKEKVAKVEKQQRAVSEKQAQGNQNEFLALGHASKDLGITPHILRPSCKEYDELIAAGPDAILMMLSMIARLTEEKAKALIARAGSDSSMLVAYGGAMHNDLSPKKGREDWSFGPQLRDHTGGKYVALDLIVPEFIGDNDSWKALPWYEHFDAAAHPGKTTLYKPAPGSYVLIFPKTETK